MSETPYRIETLGQRLDRQARYIADRCVPGCAWADPLAVLLDHLADLPAPADPRFARTEAAPAWPAWPAWPERRHELVGRRRDEAGPRLPSDVAERHSTVFGPDWRGRRDEPGGHRAGAGRPLPSDVAERLRARVGHGAAAMRVHDGERADAVATARRADAVTVGADVFFRHGRFRPREPRGFGLLIHEATHIVERLRPGASARRASATAAAAEERAALAAEAAAQPAPAVTPRPPSRHVPLAASAPALPAPIAGAFPGLRSTAPAFWPPTITSPPSAAPPHGIPATSVQPTSVPPGADTPAMAAASRPMAAPAERPATGAVDVDALRSTLMRDLMRQLRDEFERGG
jgi:hypothetical protein